MFKVLDNNGVYLIAPHNWSYNNTTLSTITDRGYTMHEHLNNFSLINMNGRAYDPKLGQFLSPDPSDCLKTSINQQNFVYK